MRRFLTAAVAAVSFAGAVAATAPAEARDHGRGYYGGRHYYRGGHDNTGTALAAGVVGLALGAALASSSSGNGRGYYESRSYYDRGYYDRDYGRGYYGGGYRTCESRERVWDPYIRRSVIITQRYAC